MPDDAEPIDAVYLWANGRDPAFRRDLRRYSREASISVSPGRYRDNGELRYSLRSIDKNVPWIRAVHLVTSCDPPPWLDTTNPRLRIVPEASFLPPDLLPTFNSNSIEWQLRKIPGLSRRFLYLCDDFFVLRPVLLSDFVGDDGGQRIVLESGPDPQHRPYRNVYLESVWHTGDLLCRRFGPAERRFVAHTHGCTTSRCSPRSS